MDDANTADLVYLDFANAFDSANHRFLVAKLESLGLCKKDVRWIRSYLTGRTYGVQVADALSQEARIKIEPLLFLLLINDFPNVINVITLFFVYDVKMVSSRSQSGL